MAESRKLVLKQTGIVFAGVLLCGALMVVVFALLGLFDLSVLWGALVGCLFATGNFLAMAMIATVAADKAEDQDVEGGKKMLKASYPIRIIVLAVLLFACAKSGVFHVVALVLPLLFVRPVITAIEFFGKKGG